MRWVPFLLAAFAFASGCGADSAGRTDAGSDAGNEDAGGDAGSDGGSDAGADGGTDGGVLTDAGLPTAPMAILSQGVPTFSSGNENSSTGPAKANDTDPSTTWNSDKMPAWIAADLSGAPAAARQTVLVAWYGPRTLDYINASPPAASAQLPIDYTVEINTAAGGTAAPTTGWTVVATVTANTRSSRQHLVALNGGNWVRLNITKGSDPHVNLDLDVHDARSGPTDSWLFMGDSITFISLPRYKSDLPARVHTAKPAYYPAVINAAIGGTNTTTAALVIDDTMSQFPGKFVTLNYGTNDHVADFNAEALVLKVLAAGKVPVIPHMPWSDQRLVEGPQINAKIDALYAKYPQIVRGPDLWEAFKNRTDLIPASDIHPNDAGQLELRKQWAAAMAAIYQ